MDDRAGYMAAGGPWVFAVERGAMCADRQCPARASCARYVSAPTRVQVYAATFGPTVHSPQRFTCPGYTPRAFPFREVGLVDREHDLAERAKVLR